MEDITQWKESESSLREVEARFAQLADNVQVGFLLADVTVLPANIIYVNPGLLSIFGLAAARALENDSNLMQSMIHPDDRHLTADDVARLRGGERIDDEFRIIRTDGQIDGYVFNEIRSPMNPATSSGWWG